ncbi:MAG: response regulator [Candidatus Pacebacteria bacterium]|nr:response regulator [Candidatus Paceibacterota bacterium]
MSLIRNILLVGITDELAADIQKCLKDNHGCSIECVTRCQEAIRRIDTATVHNPIHVVIAEARMAPMNGIALANQIKERGWVTPVILVSEVGTIDEATLASASPHSLTKDTAGRIDMTALAKTVHGLLYPKTHD